MCFKYALIFNDVILQIFFDHYLQEEQLKLINQVSPNTNQLSRLF